MRAFPVLCRRTVAGCVSVAFSLSAVAFSLGASGSSRRLLTGLPPGGNEAPAVMRHEEAAATRAMGAAGAAGAPPGGAHARRVEEERQLTLTRLTRALLTALGGSGANLRRWLAARDGGGTGRVPLEVFRAGLRAHGVLMSDADVLLVAAELDPDGGHGRIVAYTLLPMAL